MRSIPTRPGPFDPSQLPPELRARGAVLVGLARVLRDRRPMDDGRELAGLETRDRAFARLLLATILRRLGQIDDLIDHCLERPLSEAAAPVQDALRLGAAQLLFLDTPAHAAVDSTVALLRAIGWQGMAGLANAILRRVAREGANWIARQDASRLDTVSWLWDSWVSTYGSEQAQAIATAHLAEPPLDISVKNNAPEWAERLGGRVLPTGSIRVPNRGPIESLPGYDEGEWWVQDMAATLPAHLLPEIAGAHVVDLCAAPGGKTAQLVVAGARVTAVDRSARRMRRLTENLARLRLEANTVVAEAESWTLDQPPDAVLLDAPCSATGTIRRHPDAPYLKQPGDIAVFTATQDRLLAAAVRLLRPGGWLVYAVCSLEPQEGIGRIASLMAAGAPVRRVPIAAAEVGGLAELVTADGDLRTLPFHLAEQGGMDAFFAARLQKV